MQLNKVALPVLLVVLAARAHSRAVAPEDVKGVKTLLQDEARDDPFFDNNPQYDFAYRIHDEETGDAKGQTEERRGDAVHGSYSVVDPDGTLRVVKYTADDEHGFNAVVSLTPGHSKPIVAVQRRVVAVQQHHVDVPVPVQHHVLQSSSQQTVGNRRVLVEHPLHQAGATTQQHLVQPPLTLGLHQDVQHLIPQPVPQGAYQLQQLHQIPGSGIHHQMTMPLSIVHVQEPNIKQQQMGTPILQLLNQQPSQGLLNQQQDKDQKQDQNLLQQQDQSLLTLQQQQQGLMGLQGQQGQGLLNLQQGDQSLTNIQQQQQVQSLLNLQQQQQGQGLLNLQQQDQNQANLQQLQQSQVLLNLQQQQDQNQESLQQLQQSQGLLNQQQQDQSPMSLQQQSQGQSNLQQQLGQGLQQQDASTINLPLQQQSQNSFQQQDQSLLNQQESNKLTQQTQTIQQDGQQDQQDQQQPSDEQLENSLQAQEEAALPQKVDTVPTPQQLQNQQQLRSLDSDIQAVPIQQHRTLAVYRTSPLAGGVQRTNFVTFNSPYAHYTIS
ncbi:hypothetical protein ONE63_000561 [Megalurothrips usitatus]|uniref:Mediator of RNA polymerase II transcription subunit 26 n=1 Tax=Megalurothrips usitatus TaxID=439358 RepID=A0AAV7Y1D0_9NEOP|nr:hypothetical protein ONE63_000561 [Megalurothrips usitatus]